MKVVVISDIHIRDEFDPLYHSFLEMIRCYVEPGDHLVLAGDIFDFFVGRQPTLIARYHAFFDLLGARGGAGVRITYVEGNHDFHLQEAFSGIPGLSVHPSEVAFHVGGSKVYVAHGDLADPDDRGYLLLRSFFRSPFIRAAAFALPSQLVEWIGNRSSRVSQGAHPRLPPTEDAQRLAELRRIYRGFAERKFRAGYDAIVLGHCHDLDGQEYTEGSRRGTYLNVGFPRVHGSFIIFSEDGGLRRVSLPGTG